jgi:TM2 domain-containing membrane protein YozV
MDNHKISSKSRLTTFLLAFFLGGFGAHRFYVGKTGSGIGMLVLTLSVFGILVTMVWALIDWILVLSGVFRDGAGYKIAAW